MPRRALAFTLVELLTVMGIIGLLIAILLPTLGRARESGRRTQCLSNLRQVYEAFHYYALAYNDQVPIGYRKSKQFNTMIFSGTSRQFCLFGWLYTGGFLKEPRVYFCPSETNAKLMYATSDNPWPPGPAGVSTANVFSGYGCRPDLLLPDTPDPGTLLPRLSRSANLAIFADAANCPQRLDQRHKDGINVLYGNGGAHWVGRKAFDTPLGQCPDPSGAPNPVYDPQIEQIWGILDQQ